MFLRGKVTLMLAYAANSIYILKENGAKYYFNCIKKNILLRLGTIAIASPQIISSDPTTLLYHLLGTLKSSVPDSGNTFAYFTYSFLCEHDKNIDKLIHVTDTEMVVEERIGLRKERNVLMKKIVTISIW